MTERHYRSFAREWAMQFLFQNDIALVENIEGAIDIFFSQLKETENEILDEPLEGKIFKRAEKATKKLITGIIDNMPKIDALISEYSPKWSITRMDIVDRNLMRVAVYEMLFCNNVPPIVSINEAVEIGKIYGSDNTPSFINGILNSIMNTLDRPTREAVIDK